ncbi:NADH-quinone oxidoreductase subunit L [Deltaproteobacteria bacterium TL4]
MGQTLFYIVLFPLIGAAINGLFGKNLPKKLVTFIACFLPFLSFVLVALNFAKVYTTGNPIVQEVYTWIDIQGFNLSVDLYFDQLTAVMTFVITGVGTLIHIYSTGYMSHDKGYAKYFAFLNLFVFFMLMLVLGKNLVVLFVGWEGVGLCSYLLIGFWFDDEDKAIAGKKAFITNRIGDAGFLLGMFLIFWYVKSFDIMSINAFFHQGLVTTGIASLIGILLFVGASGKSAQIPLYVWLPDAMAGPTPVSALIHAATMVTAGVYMIARLSGLYIEATFALQIVGIIGGLTALMAASIGLVQNDIKKVLAYSTVSQLGFMFMALGAGAFVAAIFHLFTHAFFKACLFLGSGSVIHAMHHEQDMRKMGGLKAKMPVTFWTFLVATIAIAGIPPFAGFFSKDEILWQVYASPHGSRFVWLLGTVAALFTSFYMFRIVYMTFLGKSRVSKDVHPHESPFSMISVLTVLAVFSAGAGFLGVPQLIGGMIHLPNIFEHFVGPVIENPHITGHGHALEISLMFLSIGIALLGWVLAHLLYSGSLERAENLKIKFQSVHKLLYNKYWIDELYQKFIIDPLKTVSEKVFLNVVDKGVIDGFLHLMVTITQRCANGFSRIQTGSLHAYALYIFIGIVFCVAWGYTNG